MTRPNGNAPALLLATFTGLAAGPAWAHTGTGLSGGLLAGLLHPLSGLDHLLAMVSVGLWGAFLGRPLVYLLPVAFPAMMVVGAMVGMFGLPMPPVELGVGLSVLVLGGCVALALKAPAWTALPIVAAFALFHGYAHGRELPSAADPVGYSTGFVICTGALHVAGILLGLLKASPGGTLALRGLGGAIAVAGAVLVARAAA